MSNKSCCTDSDRVVSIDGLRNVRDLGGVKVRSGGVFKRGVVLRGESPQFATKEGAGKLVDYGVTNIIDLRTSIEVRSEGYGYFTEDHQGSVEIYHLPIIMDDQWKVDLVGSGKKEERYLSFLKWLDSGGDVSLVRILNVIASSKGASYIHCAAGKDRTGMVASILYDLAEANYCCIEHDYLLTNTNVMEVLSRLGQSDTYQRDLKNPNIHAQLTREGEITEFLDKLKERTAIIPWLLSRGLEIDTFNLLKKRLLTSY